MLKKNILFISLFIGIVLFIAVFNYVVDPYEIFRPNRYKNGIFDEPRELMYLYMKKYKNFSHETICMGTSENSFIFGPKPIVDERLAVFVVHNSNVKDRYELLKNYLMLHPETKHVYITISYTDLFRSGECDPLPPFNKYITLKELYDVLISGKTFKASLKTIKQYGFKTFKMRQQYYDYFNFPLFIRPKNTAFPLLPQTKLMTNYENTCLYTKKTIDLLKEKNIKYDIIIPPYNVVLLFLTHNDKVLNENIEKYKKFLTQNSEVVYDFAFVNKYTVQNLFENNFIFMDLQHITIVYGIKLFKYFFVPDNAEKDICILLNKSNVDEKIKEENKLIEDYIKNHPDVVEYYVTLQKNFDINDTFFQYKNKVPKNSLKEMEEIYQKLRKENR